MERYFDDRTRSCYEQEISFVALEIIKSKPEQWEDKLFLEIFRQQRTYLDSFLDISLDSDLTRYVLLKRSDENPAKYLMEMVKKIRERKFNNFSVSVEKFIEARGCNEPGDSEKIIDAARSFFDDYIYYLEMLYDVEFLYMPDGGEIRIWFKEAIKVILEKACFVLLNRMELLVTKILNKEEYDENILCLDIKIDLDMELIEKQMVVFMVKCIAEKITTIHFIPHNYLSNCQKGLVVMPIEEYTEYLELKNN